MSMASALKALASPRRPQILEWLKDPEQYLPPEADGDLVRDGVCGVLIAEQLGLSPPTVSEHLRIFTQTGLLRARRIKQWTFYKRHEPLIAKIKQAILIKV